MADAAAIAALRVEFDALNDLMGQQAIQVTQQQVLIADQQANNFQLQQKLQDIQDAQHDAQPAPPGDDAVANMAIGLVQNTNNLTVMRNSPRHVDT